MTSSLIGSTNNYLSVIGNSWLAQTNRIMQLNTGSIPYEADYNSIVDGYVGLSLSSNPAQSNVEDLYHQLEMINASVGAMEMAYEGLDQINVRLDMVKQLSEVVRDESGLSSSQVDNINDQINLLLTEVEEIATTINYNDVTLLDGYIQSEGLYLNLSGGYSVDITDAFTAATPEALGLPEAGYAQISASNAGELVDQTAAAINQIQYQLGTIEAYEDYLISASKEISDTFYVSSANFSTINLAPLVLNSSFGSSQDGSDLYLTMSAIVNNVMYDTRNYDRILSLLN